MQPPLSAVRFRRLFAKRFESTLEH